MKAALITYLWIFLQEADVEVVGSPGSCSKTQTLQLSLGWGTRKRQSSWFLLLLVSLLFSSSSSVSTQLLFLSLVLSSSLLLSILFIL